MSDRRTTDLSGAAGYERRRGVDYGSPQETIRSEDVDFEMAGEPLHEMPWMDRMHQHLAESGVTGGRSASFVDGAHR